MMHIKLVFDIAPPTPPCFPSRMQWAEYLHSAQESGKVAVDRPFDKRGIYIKSFDFCEDCTKAHCLAMQSRACCKPRYLQDPAPAKKQQKVAA